MKQLWSFLQYIFPLLRSHVNADLCVFKKSPAAQRTAKRAEVTAESLIQEVTEAENR